MHQRGKKQMNKNKTLADLQKIWHKNQEAEFTYRSGLPYILLTEQKIQPDMFYLDYAYSDSMLTRVNSYLLDKNLAIVSTNHHKRDLEKELKQFIDLQSSPPYLSYINGQYQLPIPALPSIKYIQFPEINDFHFGRTGFGRQNQSYKIQSDSISKDHCSITHLKTNSSHQIKKFAMLKDKLKKWTAVSSAARKITDELWQIIWQFAGLKERYILCDLGSRNGTWISKAEQKKILMKQNMEFQYEGQNYSIHISKTFTKKNTVQLSITEHNVWVQQYLQQFRKEINWCYYEPAKKMIIFGPGEQMAKNLSNYPEKVQIVVLKIKYREFHQFYFLGVTQSDKKIFQIGSKQEIDVSPDEEEYPTLHGSLYLSDGNWFLESASNFVTSNGKIWTKIPKDYSYNLNPRHNYKMRLGYTATFDIQFYNF